MSYLALCLLGLIVAWGVVRRPLSAEWVPLPCPGDGSRGLLWRLFGRRLYIQFVSAARNEAVRKTFWNQSRDPRTRERIAIVLEGDEDWLFEWDSFWTKVPAASSRVACFEIRCRTHLRVCGWAQTRGGGDTPEDRQIILGIEHPICRWRTFIEDIAGHELVHCAQQVREQALSREWQPYSVAFWSRIELEAFLHFPMPLLTAGGLLVALPVLTLLLALKNP